MDENTSRPTSHLTRLARYLLASGAIALAVSTFIQWDAVESGGSIQAALAAQVLMVIGTVALTGAVFGYVLLALRNDRAEDVAGDQRSDSNWFE
jgi:hypothetical protein